MNKKQSTFSSVTERDKKLIFILLTILVLAITYFFIVTPNFEKKTSVTEKNKSLRAEVTRLEEMEKQKTEKTEGIVVFNEKRDTILNKFPGGMTHEKSITILDELESETELVASTVNFVMNDKFYDSSEARAEATISPEATLAPGTTAAPAATVAPASTVAPTSTSAPNVAITKYNDIFGYKSTLTLTFSATDEALTKAIDFINQYKDKMSIETITVGFDPTTGNLSGTMNLCMYALAGTDKQYEAPLINNVKTGVANIFGSMEVKGKKKR